MEKDRKTKMIAIAALIVGVVGLSLGFAAFSNTLTIKSSAEVTPDDSIFNVDFSKQSGSVVDGTVTPTLSPTGGPAEFVGSDATIDNTNDPVIRNLHATFTEPGQSVTYNFYTKNAGALKAYLKNVTFANVSGQSTTKVCAPKTGSQNPATASLVNAACSGISLTMTLGSESFTASKARAEFTSATAHDLEVDGYEAVTVVISYASGSAQADGDFDVSFGDITLLYSSAE